jgi:nanoRNase/pAp phosphatase (c-di-AMP/oligoRNAs hydrolase)
MAATALTHGILTDTRGLIRAGPDDFHAAAYLSQYRDPDLLEQILNQSRPKRTMEVIHRALEDKVTVEGLSIAGGGYLRTEERDAIPLTADFLVTEENVHTAVVYGVVSGIEMEECIVGSLRTTKITLDPDEFLKEIFGKDCAGRFFGGGKASAGGFRIPIGFLAGGEDEEFRGQKWRVFDEQIKHKLLAKIGAKGPDGVSAKAKAQIQRRARSSTEHGEIAEGAL